MNTKKATAPTAKKKVKSPAKKKPSHKHPPVGFARTPKPPIDDLISDVEQQRTKVLQSRTEQLKAYDTSLKHLYAAKKSMV